MGKHPSANKLKIINDPVYGFIKIPFPLVYDLIARPEFQRLRRIRQLGLTNYVYPGANHSRFQHAIGAMHLMQEAIEVIRSRGHEISAEEAQAVTLAILLHDIGHGPFSHSLENSLIRDTSHEEISLMYMESLNQAFQGALDMAICIFKNEYPKRFLHQLVSSQLDMDRLDYLKRDSFFTGVTEGVIGSDRIIKMLNVADDSLVVDQKGIYSIEKFLIARRLMYWQVYLHRTVVGAEQLLLTMLKRARELYASGDRIFATPALSYFLEEVPDRFRKDNQKEFLSWFTLLDDNDILASAKAWCNHSDKVLSLLADGLVNRGLFTVQLEERPVEEEQLEQMRKKVAEHLGVSTKEAACLVISESVSNYAYSDLDDRISIMDKKGQIRDITEASDMLSLDVLSKNIQKHFLCHPKFLGEIMNNNK